MCAERTCPRYSGCYQGPLREDVEIKLCERCRLSDAMRGYHKAHQTYPEPIMKISCTNPNCRNSSFSNLDTPYVCSRCLHVASLERTGKPAPPAVAPKPEGWISNADQPYGTKAITDVYRIRVGVVTIPYSKKHTIFNVEILRRRRIFKDYWEFVDAFDTEAEAIEFVQNLQQPMKYFEVKHPA